MRIEVPDWAHGAHVAASRAAARFQTDVHPRSGWAVRGTGPVRHLAMTCRNLTAAHDASYVLVEVSDGDAVLARSRVSGRSVGHLRKAVPSLCEQIAYCLMSGASLPHRQHPEGAREAQDAWVRSLAHKVRVAPYARDWSVELINAAPTAVFEEGASHQAMTVSPRFGTVFWADPFLCTDEAGQLWLFVESMDRWTGRGSIMAGRLDGGRIRDLRTVLTTPHAAFPRIVRVGDTFLATVESMSAVNPIYTFDRMGQPWRPHPSWCLPAHLADPVLHVNDDESLVAYGTDRTVCSAGAVVSYTSAGPGQAWVRSTVPFMYDVVAGRSGGGVYADQRITQDCSGSYGMRVHRTPVTGLDGSLDSQVLSPSTLRMEKTVGGMHTLNGPPEGPTVVDTWRHRPDPRALPWRLIERRALRVD